MSYKILITISDDLKAIIDNYSRENPFEPLHISEISAKAIFEKITSLDKDIAMKKTEVMNVSKKMKVSTKESNEKEVLLHDINVEHYTDKLERIVDRPEHSELEPLHKTLTPIHENIHSLHYETIPDNVPEPIKAPIPIHEHVHKLNSELIPKTKEQACAADFFCNECDTIEKIEEEPLHEIQTYKGKKEPIIKICEVCGKTFPAKTKRSCYCSEKCRKAKSREKGKEKAGKI